MGVLICANPTVYLWLNAITARAERDVLQVAGQCDPTPGGVTSQRNTLPANVVQAIPRGQMLRGPYCPGQGDDPRFSDPSSLETWKHPLDAIAKTWSRLLVLVGLRR